MKVTLNHKFVKELTMHVLSFKCRKNNINKKNNGPSIGRKITFLWADHIKKSFYLFVQCPLFQFFNKLYMLLMRLQIVL